MHVRGTRQPGQSLIPPSHVLRRCVACFVVRSQTSAAPLLNLSNENISRTSIRSFDSPAWLIRRVGTADAQGCDVMKLTPVIVSIAANQLGCDASRRSLTHPRRSRDDEAHDSPGRHNRQFVSGRVSSRELDKRGRRPCEPVFFQTHNTGVSPTKRPNQPRGGALIPAARLLQFR